MKFYLSSYRLGNDSARLASLVSGARRIGVIRNALDFSDDHDRLREGWEQEASDLIELGFTPEPLDLREYFDGKGDLRAVVSRLDGLWVVGGNTFILNSAFRQSGLDKILVEQLPNETFVYAGYSAGICVLAPTLKGIHLADDPDTIPPGYPDQVIWEGIGLLPYCIAPHWQSDHPESGMIDDCVEYYLKHKIPFIALSDGETYVTEVSALPKCFTLDLSD